MSAPSSSPATCPSCAAPASGRFCSECGAPLAGATCAACATPLSPGAKFCHHCGAGVGGAPAPHAAPLAGAADDGGSILPWAVAGIALLALIASLAGSRFFRPPVVAATGDAGPVMAPPPTAAADGVVRGPDISSLTPRDAAERLYDRAMRAREQGKTDSAAFFATMATMAYQRVESLSTDDRFDMGRVAILAGAVPLAKAQADTILAAHPTHLLGLLLAEETSRALGDQKTAKAEHDKLVAAASAERKKNLPEYQRHQSDIAAATGGRTTP